MTIFPIQPFNPTLDLLLERIVEVPKELVWAAWTQPEHLKKWFTPAPWRTAECEIDLRPGGIFRTVMQSPDGESFNNEGCYLEIVPNERLVWTSALSAGFRPAAANQIPGFHMTAIISLTPEGKGTRYIARVLHSDPKSREQHEAMGFHHGWSAALDQLVALASSFES